MRITKRSTQNNSGTILLLLSYKRGKGMRLPGFCDFQFKIWLDFAGRRRMPLKERRGRLFDSTDPFANGPGQKNQRDSRQHRHEDHLKITAWHFGHGFGLEFPGHKSGNEIAQRRG